MADLFKKLYDDISSRKAKPEDFAPYTGGNGRIDRAVNLILNSPDAACDMFPKSGTLLDVGGATGNLGYALRDHFQERWTLDISDVCREPAEKKGNRFICANVDLHGFVEPEKGYAGGGIVDGEVDLIVALDFIEHILDPQKFVKECFRALKPGGVVLINTPNIQFWKHLESLVIYGRFPHTSGDREVYHGGHVAFYNFHDMMQMFEVEGGFEGSRMHTHGLTAEPPPPIWEQLPKMHPGGGSWGPDVYGTYHAPMSRQLSYGDLVYSVRKPK